MFIFNNSKLLKAGPFETKIAISKVFFIFYIVDRVFFIVDFYFYIVDRVLLICHFYRVLLVYVIFIVCHFYRV